MFVQSNITETMSRINMLFRSLEEYYYSTSAHFGYIKSMHKWQRNCMLKIIFNGASVYCIASIVMIIEEPQNTIFYNTR